MNFLAELIRIWSGLASRFRNLWFRALGVQITGYVWIRRISIPRQWRSITLEESVCLDDGVVLLSSGVEIPNKIVIKCGTYINRYTMIDAHEGIEIGRNCMIGPHCYITDANHGTELSAAMNEQLMTTTKVFIGDGAWLGAGVIVLTGVRVGQGAVVGAGAVVTSDIPANAVYAGVPAREIGIRAGKLANEHVNS